MSSYFIDRHSRSMNTLSIQRPRPSMEIATPASASAPVKATEVNQYTSVAFGNRCKEAGVRPSTGSVGDAYDNAMCESFFATLECELINRRRFRSHSEARMAVFQFIEGFYNPSRRHSALGYLSPIGYERKHDGLSKPA